MTLPASLLLRLAGPMQSWGVQSRFGHRDTARQPSKSGILGLLCAALGRPRDAPLDDLVSLEMAVRVEREGRLLRDFHTAGGGDLPPHFRRTHGLSDRQEYGVSRANRNPPQPDISNRYYLADADFLVALGGPRPLLEALAAALAAPRWPLFLGRKAFLPGEPILPPEPLRDGTPLSTLRAEPWIRRHPRDHPPERLRLVLESTEADGGIPVRDVPLSFVSNRRSFALRHIRQEFLHPVPVREVRTP